MRTANSGSLTSERTTRSSRGRWRQVLKFGGVDDEVDGADTILVDFECDGRVGFSVTIDDEAGLAVDGNAPETADEQTLPQAFVN